ncbi:hypothetical protein LMTR13_25770 [Bradyrhizobium icense]|uniref:Uncharacterized protein n=1 Tax=Bradyrhizobium icense TaxID=1274631 RepID=A0A1B1UJT4_9BRAD|nr:hypothetical protein LMTR13_25770 [Bradyrhizobium icense]
MVRPVALSRSYVLTAGGRHRRRGACLARADPTAFDFLVIYEVATGAWTGKVIGGDPTLEATYMAAAKQLVERGAVA